MGLVSVPGGLWIPAPVVWGGNIGPTYNEADVISASGHKLAWTFYCPKAGDLSKVRFRLGSVTKDGTTELKISFQNISATTGDPDGTPDEYRIIPNGSIVADSIVYSGIITDDGTDVGNKRTVAQGDRIQAVLEFDTFVAGDSIEIESLTVGVRQGGPGVHFSYVDLNTGSWAKQNTAFSGLGLEYSDGSYAYMMDSECYSDEATQQVYSNASSPDEYGLMFQLPFDCYVGACTVAVDADGDFDVVLYDSSSGTTVQSIDKDMRQTTIGHVGGIRFTADQQIDRDTDYVLSFKPTTTTSIRLAYNDVPAAAVMDQLGGGQNFRWCSAKDPTDSGDFTPTSTRRPTVCLLVTQVDDGDGAGATNIFNILD